MNWAFTGYGIIGLIFLLLGAIAIATSLHFFLSRRYGSDIVFATGLILLAIAFGFKGRALEQSKQQNQTPPPIKNSE